MPTSINSAKQPLSTLPSWISIKRWARLFRSSISTRAEQAPSLVADRNLHPLPASTIDRSSNTSYIYTSTSTPESLRGSQQSHSFSQASIPNLSPDRSPSPNNDLVNSTNCINASPTLDSSESATVLPPTPVASSPPSSSFHPSSFSSLPSSSLSSTSTLPKLQLVPTVKHTLRDFSDISRPSSDPVYTGPYSRVYKQEYQKETLAIKVVRSVGTLPAIRRRMRREVETGSRVDHPNILPILGVIEADWCLYGCIVTRWAINGDAAHWIRRGHVSGPDRLQLFRGVSAGLQHLHGRSIVHGDLKPQNVLIGEFGNPLICDFGLARILDAESHDQGDDLNTTTLHTGTVRYLAFELVEPDTPAERTTASDVHALGCVGYEFLYLEKPYASRLNNAGGHIFRDIANRIPPARRPPPPLGSQEAIIWDLLELCWDIHPERRPTTSTVCDTLDIVERTL
ncbi:hypothetical protein M408DRAFT_143011 [Serendipita vermifera MAFF 305830]|uniref:Protein kinase domain-containing protein n=1 Tax=Serendipita vermifera MAFF 305830 TaxID=933852 RepID=A0A0C3AJP6_SERVB|nr:hypothetical protein M408DRAFT_143011 [Serendipita vermifera MAFF 305830]